MLRASDHDDLKTNRILKHADSDYVLYGLKVSSEDLRFHRAWVRLLCLSVAHWASWAVKTVGEGNINYRQGSPRLPTSDTIFLSPPKHSRLVRPQFTLDSKAQLCTRISKLG